jgi:glutathione synthase/RimK-type ligase-like ATP-grasp enzyme
LSIAILYEHAETDELGIRMTAKEMGIDLTYIPFHKIAVSISNSGYSFKSQKKNYFEIIDNVNAVLNRTQSKNRRLYAASFLEAIGKYVINPLQVESLCFSKFRTLVEFWKQGIKIPKTIFIPCDSRYVTSKGRIIHNEEKIADLITNNLGESNIVLKPDAGTHGYNIKLVNDRNELVKIVGQTEHSIINPVGFVAQEFVKKWFYDLRIIVTKERGAPPHCHPKALARAGFKDFRTNTYLGNMVFGINLPIEVRKAAVQSSKAIGGNSETWLLALDAMFNIGEEECVDNTYIKDQLDELVIPFDAVKKVKIDDLKYENFAVWNEKLESAYQNYMDTEAYENVRIIIEESAEKEKNNVLFHEANSCPEFWEQTRIFTEMNVAAQLFKCAKSVEGWSIYQRVRENEYEQH